MSDGNGTPDSWDQNTTLANDLSQKISTLNVNAAEFVPNFGTFGQKSEKSADVTGIHSFSIPDSFLIRVPIELLCNPCVIYDGCFSDGEDLKNGDIASSNGTTSRKLLSII